MNTESAALASHERLERVLGWFTIARGCLALFLGFALLLQREGTSESLATFMGLYWLTGGILALTFHREIRRAGARRMPIVAGIFGITAGSALLIGGFLLKEPPTEEETFFLIGLLIAITGLTNLISGARTGADTGRQWNRTSLALGLLEVLLGAGLIVRGGAPGAVLILATTAWALIAGVVLVRQGLAIRRRAAGRLYD
jgi:uncharacterized membrane protein HdeD (DUF308 family)